MEEVLTKAEKDLNARRAQEALESYIQAAIRWPACRELIRPQFVNSLCGVLDEMLRMQGPSSPLFRRLLQSVYSLYSRDPLVVAVLGTKCLKEGALKEAGVYLQAALNLDPCNLLARENMVALREQLVQRWHFRMLNDVTRNSTYFRAIKAAVQGIPDCTVLDIGSGTGILSMMAVRSGARFVYACELNETFAAMSCDILSTNGMQNQVKVINSPSTGLSVPNNLPTRVSLVVTETVDAGLLGEWIIPSLRHAWAELLLPGNSTNEAGGHVIPCGGHVIPCGATVFATLIECSEIRRQSRLLSSSVAGVDFGSVRLEGSCCAPSPSGRGCIKGYRPSCSTPLRLMREPYACERLSGIRGGFRKLSETVTVLEFDFTDPQIPLPPSTHVSLPITAEGTLDAVAIWFKLHLDHTHYLLTAPSEETSWDQAIFPLATPLLVKEGRLVTVCTSCSDTCLEVTVSGVEGVDGVEGVSDVGGVSGVEDVEGVNGMKEYGSSDCSYFVERSDLHRLNDPVYVSAYQQAITATVTGVLEEHGAGDGCGARDECGAGDRRGARDECGACDGCDASEGAKCVVLDFSQGLSIAGLIAACKGAEFVVMSQLPSMYTTLMDRLVRTNRLKEHISIRYQTGAEWVCAGVVWDVVLCDLVSPQGMLLPGVLEELHTLRSLSPSALCIPSRVSVYLVLLLSPCLRAWSAVLGTLPTLGFDVACHINKYQVTHYTDLDLTSVPHQTISDHTHICTLNPGEASTTVEQTLCVEVTSDGAVTGIAYWFRLHLHGDLVIDTGPTCPSGHWHQSVFMLPEDVSVSRGEQVRVHAIVKDSCLLLELEQTVPHT